MLCVTDFHEKYTSTIFLTEDTVPTQISLMNISQTKRLETFGVRCAYQYVCMSAIINGDIRAEI